MITKSLKVLVNIGNRILAKLKVILRVWFANSKIKSFAKKAFEYNILFFNFKDFFQVHRLKRRNATLFRIMVGQNGQTVQHITEHFV